MSACRALKHFAEIAKHGDLLDSNFICRDVTLFLQASSFIC